MLSLWHLLTFFPLSFNLEKVSLCYNSIRVSVGLSLLRLWLPLSCQIECFPCYSFASLSVVPSCTSGTGEGLDLPRQSPGSLVICFLRCVFSAPFKPLPLLSAQTRHDFFRLAFSMEFSLCSLTSSAVAALVLKLHILGFQRVTHPGISTRESESVFTVALESPGCSIVSPPSMWPPVMDVFFLPVPSR